MLQNLIVCPAHDRKGRPTGDYEVVGGRRRLRALQALAKEGEISKDEEILCRVKPTLEAAEASLAENVAREAMHPADEFEAFKRLVDEGRSVEDVALRFGTSALTVRRRLKLAGLHPKLVALYRQDGITLEQLMALAVSDDQEEQLSVWESAPEWQSDPASLRRMLVEQEIDAARDPLARLVGLAAYEAAGGPVRRDLFDDEGGGYVQDAALLQRLAMEKLEAAAETVRSEGWAWVEVAPRFGASELFRFDRCRKTRREMTKAESKRHAAMAKREAELDERLERHFGGEDDLDEDALATVGDHAISHHRLQEAGVPGGGHQGPRFVGEAIDRPLMGGTVLAQIRHLGLPGGELVVEVLQVAEHPPGHEVALDVLHARLDLALGLSAVRLAQPRGEAPVRGEGGERRVQSRPAPTGAEHDGAHAVVQQELAAPAEVGERGLVRRQQVGHALAQEAQREAAPAEAQRHHEDVDLGAHPA